MMKARCITAEPEKIVGAVIIGDEIPGQGWLVEWDVPDPVTLESEEYKLLTKIADKLNVVRID